MNHIYCILVIYNKEVHHSPSYCFINNHKDIPLIVCDNSTQDYKNKETVLGDGNIYLSKHENIGLSKAYNMALDAIQLQDVKEQSYVMFMDDDTELNEEYIEWVLHASLEKDVYLPIVTDEIGILSPSQFVNGISKRIDSLDALHMGAVTGINSGMLVNFDIFNDYRFNEELFLDYVDHNFLYDMKLKKKSIGIFDVEIHQHFSGNGTDKKQAFSRFQIYKQDSKSFYKVILLDSRLYKKVIRRRKLSLLKRFKDVRILWK